MLGTQDLLEQQGFFEARIAPSFPAEQEHIVETLRPVLVGRTIADVERHLILDTLAHCFGNRTHAAKLLGISIRTLRNKLNDYIDAGFAVPEPGQRPAAAV